MAVAAALAPVLAPEPTKFSCHDEPIVVCHEKTEQQAVETILKSLQAQVPAPELAERLCQIGPESWVHAPVVQDTRFILNILPLLAGKLSDSGIVVMDERLLQVAFGAI